MLPALRRVARWLGPQRRFEELAARADEMIFELVEERRRREARRSGGEDVLAMLLAGPARGWLADVGAELRDELMTALVAGHETTASQLAWAFERLAREPAVVGRLADELDRGESDEYLTATIYEILRRKPVLPNAEPRLTKRPITIGGWDYPPGVALLASAYLVHHDPEIYPDPYALRPERFLRDPPGTYTWIPFGGGRRRCIGASFALQEMKIVLRAVLSRYELAPGGEQPERTGRRSITFSPTGGATVVLKIAIRGGPARARPRRCRRRPEQPVPGRRPTWRPGCRRVWRPGHG